jgi:glyoxylase-like metal-dependent hydrolase (beta-lactamase superfamily II)
VTGPEITDLGGGVHRVTHPLPYALDHVHTYAIEDADGWTIVDAGHVWEAEERWRAALDELGSPHVARLVITHYHPDHIGGSRALQELTGAQVVQGRHDLAVTERMYGGGRMNVPIKPPAPDVILDEDDVFEAGSRRFRIFHMPGHADGHITLLDEERGELFGGDVILHRITPNVSWWPGMMHDPLAHYYRTLERLEELAPRLVYPGHHWVIEDAAGRAREIREHHHVRLDETERHLREGAVTPEDVLVRLWGRKLTPHEYRFAYGEAVSHLQRLEQLGRAREVEQDRWQATSRA